MITIIQRYLIRRLVVASLLSIAALVLPVVLISLFNHLPKAAILSDLVWPALYGIAPPIFYLCLPVAVGIAVTWTYGHLQSESTLTIMQMSGLSEVSIRAPAIAVAVIATALGYVTSLAVAPHGTKRLQDVLHVIQNDLSPTLLQPNRFYYLSGGQRVFQFQDRLGRSWVSGVFLSEIAENNEERVFFAKDAVFERHEDESWIVMRDGIVQSRATGRDAGTRTMAFEQMVRPTGLVGKSFPQRTWRGVFEMNSAEFLGAAAQLANDPTEHRRWVSEFFKRFIVPPLAIVHCLLGLALGSLWAGVGRNQRRPTEAACTVILLIHIGIAFAVEYTGVQDVRLAWLAGAIILAEIALVIALLARKPGNRERPVIAPVPLQRRLAADLETR